MDRPLSKEVIYIDGVDVGFVSYAETDEAIYLDWIQIRPEHRGQGIRRRVALAVAAKAERLGKPVYGDVPPWLPESSKSFYREIGFTDLFSYGPANAITRIVWNGNGDTGPATQKYLLPGGVALRGKPS